MTLHLSKFVHSATGRLIMSVLLGFGLASFFRTVCKKRNCIVFSAAPLDNFAKNIYKNEGKCYSYVAHATKCDKRKKIIPFYNDKHDII